MNSKEIILESRVSELEEEIGKLRKGLTVSRLRENGVIACQHKQHWRTLQEDGTIKKVCCKCNKKLKS